MSGTTTQSALRFSMTRMSSSKATRTLRTALRFLMVSALRASPWAESHALHAADCAAMSGARSQPLIQS